MLTFAYGSNMNWDQFRERCPSATFVAVAQLPDHRLAFTRRSTTRACGVADAVHDVGKEVWGVVYQISERDVGNLDASEGFRPDRNPDDNSYVRRSHHVFVDGDEDQPLFVEVYLANRQKNPPKPNQNYKDLILSGACHWHLPDWYIKEVINPIETD